jgi:hypothetical protein
LFINQRLNTSFQASRYGVPPSRPPELKRCAYSNPTGLDCCGLARLDGFTPAAAMACAMPASSSADSRLAASARAALLR